MGDYPATKQDIKKMKSARDLLLHHKCLTYSFVHRIDRKIDALAEKAWK